MSDVEVKAVYKQDIDDNCPLTGDETDTEDIQNFKNNDKSKEKIDALSQCQENSADDVETIGKPSSDYANSITFRAIEEDEDESFSSDHNYLSDEETSSIAESFDDFGKEDMDDSCTSEPTSQTKREDKLKRLALRKHLDQLGELVVEKEYSVQQAREELQKCRNRLSSLQEELQKVASDIKESEKANKKSAFYRLQSMQEKLIAELSIEKKVEEKAMENIEHAELCLAQTYIEHAKFLPFDDMLDGEDKQNEKLKADKVSGRIRKEMANAMMADRRKKNRDKEHVATVRERERKNRHAVIAAKKNREVAMKYLKDTMSRVRQRESEEEDKSRHDLNQRMSALLSLKKNIELNKENITAVQARDAHVMRKEQLKEKQEREKLLSMGENPDEVLTRRKRIRQFERDKEAFERKQREREIEIVNKIAQEEKQLKRRYQQQPQLWPENRPRRMPRKRSKPRCAPSSGSESMEYGADVEDTGGKLSTYLNKFSTDEEGEFSPYGATNRDDDYDDKTTTTEEDEWEYGEGGEEGDDVYAEADFKNLWEKGCNEIAENKLGNWKSGNREYSKLEQEMMKTALSKQKQNIVQQQVAAGREFKGYTFVSKPNMVTFKDYDIGETYKKKVLLTNVSYSQTYCKFIGMSENLKDFIDVNFNPPGQLSAGLTCDLLVTFEPKVNRDIIGSIEMMSQAGVFYIPVKCLVKKCEIEVDVKEIRFEKEVVGETVKKMFTLKNNGALGTEFKFCKVDKDFIENKRSKISSAGDMSTDAILENKHSPDPEDGSHSDVEAAEDCDDVIRIGKIANGMLQPFSSLHLDVIFAPVKAGSYECDFVLMFSDPNLKPIALKAKGSSIDLPVWVERELVDLKICMFDRLYQDAIIVSNRATSALRIRFEIPKELKNHLDILPKTAYVQSESQFSAQLKFLPRKTLVTDAEEYINKGADLLEAPIVIRVADQTQPVPFMVRAVVTSSDFEFNMEEVNFGYCSVYETVYQTVELHNKSVLPQQFGFVNLPEVISVQPNDGFGTVLPNEKSELFIYFSPTKAKDYRFNLLCKSYIGREFTIRCRAIGVFPPLKLSHSLIKFKATAVNDSSSTHIFVVNDHTSTNQFTHSVPKIGDGEIFPVGPTSFHFMTNKDAPISISPAIGTIHPGTKCIVHVTFSPKLNKEELDKKAIELETEAIEKQKQKHNQEVKLEPIESTKDTKTKAKAPPTKATNPTAPNNRIKGNVPSKVACKKNDKNDTEKQNYQKKAQIALQRTYEKNFKTYKIPCFIKYGECGDVQEKEEDKFSLYNTLSLEVHCPTVRPSMIVVSDKGDNLVDFGMIPMGQRHSQVISMQNISEDGILLKSSLLDPTGPFEIVNALRVIEPGAVHTIRVSFSPQDDSKFHEVLEMCSSTTTVQVHLKGQGIKPQVTMEPPGRTFDVGDALVMDTIYKPLKITNTSKLSLMFGLTLGSLSSLRHNRMQTIPLYLQTEEEQERNNEDSYNIGPPNKSGLCLFGCEPSFGTLEPGECKEILVSFSPDHPSELFRDELEVNVNGIEEFTRLHLVGRAWPSMTFTRGWDKLGPSEESLHATLLTDKHESPEKKVLLTLYSSLDGPSFSKAIRYVEIGCIKASILTKKSCDFYFDNTKNANENGFTMEPMKGGVDIGARKQLAFKWNPPQKYDPQHLVKSTVQLVVRGDTTTTYNILLRGCIKTKVSLN